MDAVLKAGAAKCLINPTPDMFPFPPFWGTSLEDVYSDMYVKALALESGGERVLILVFDCGSGDLAFRKELEAHCGVPTGNILCCQIHNHGCPMMGNGPNRRAAVENDPRERYLTLIHDQALAAASQALARLRPARLGYGEGKSYINVNRDLQLENGSWSQTANYEGISDKTLAVLKLVDEDGNLIAALLNHCTHANTTYLGRDVDGKSKTCADFPGFTCAFLEQRYGEDAVVMWTSGAAGDQNAIQCYRGDAHYTGEEDINYPAPAGLTYRYAQFLGERHGVDADRVLRGISCTDGAVELKTASTVIEFDEQTLPEGTDRLLTTLKAQNSVRIMQLLYPENVRDGDIVDRTLPEPVLTGGKVPCEMQLFLLGPVAIVTAAAELYNKLGLLCKERSPVKNTFVITHGGGITGGAGYVQDDDSRDHLVFQHYGRVHPGNCNQIVLDGMARLFAQVTAAHASEEETQDK